jgi:hypothetical protein
LALKPQGFSVCLTYINSNLHKQRFGTLKKFWKNLNKFTSWT